MPKKYTGEAGFKFNEATGEFRGRINGICFPTVIYGCITLIFSAAQERSITTSKVLEMISAAIGIKVNSMVGTGEDEEG